MKPATLLPPLPDHWTRWVLTDLAGGLRTDAAGKTVVPDVAAWLRDDPHGQAFVEAWMILAPSLLIQVADQLRDLPPAKTTPATYEGGRRRVTWELRRIARRIRDAREARRRDGRAADSGPVMTLAAADRPRRDVIVVTAASPIIAPGPSGPGPVTPKDTR